MVRVAAFFALFVLTQGVEKRDYDFDVFWVGFPLKREDGRPLFEDAGHAELIVQIHSSQGRVSWPVPPAPRDGRNAEIGLPARSSLKDAGERQLACQPSSLRNAGERRLVRKRGLEPPPGCPD